MLLGWRWWREHTLLSFVSPCCICERRKVTLATDITVLLTKVYDETRRSSTYKVERRERREAALFVWLWPAGSSFDVQQDVALLPNGDVNTQNRALHVSLYAKFLSRWLHVFPRRQLHIVDGGTPFHPIHLLVFIFIWKPLVKIRHQERCIQNIKRHRKKYSKLHFQMNL